MHPWRAHNIIMCSEAQESTSSCFKNHPICDTPRYHETINQHDADLVNKWGGMPPCCQARAWQHTKSTRCRFLAVVPKGNTKGMAHAFKIKLWDMFNIPGYYNILTNSQYKLPNSNDSYMQLRAPTACPKWNKGTDEDAKILQWLSIHAGLTSECVSEVIEPFARQWVENTTRQVMQPPPHPAKVVASNAALSSSVFEQYTLLNRLTEAEAQLTSTGNDVIVISQQNL